MSREIKFRGLTKDGRLVYGCLYEFRNSSYITINKAHPKYNAGFQTKSFNYGLLIHPSFEVIPETVGQSTGLCDKNGKDLGWYAGDIIQKGEIIRAITVDWEHGRRFMLGKHILCKQDGRCGTKIGNVHNNPELIEESK